LKNNSDNKLIVQFSHPGAEYIPYKKREDPNIVFDNSLKISGRRKWNNLKSHKRKFIQSIGNFISEDNILHKDKKLTFWGEWEAESNFKMINDNDTPRFVHYPILDTTYNGPTKHNTDPFVFGNNFWYTNCKQNSRPFLQRMSKNSIILFGTEGKTNFKLDTVFVIKQKFNYLEIQSGIKSFSEQLIKTNFTMNNMLFDKNKTHYSYYVGKNFNDDKNLFSFSPSKILNKNTSVGHERVLLNVNDFSLQKIGAGTVCKRLLLDKSINNNLHDKFLYDYWKKIVNACFDQGFVLGFDFELPKII
tara:strand:+ start:3271 stop:4179 length:909 start_codon:yes stop_codon:yes gene_type:complete